MESNLPMSRRDLVINTLLGTFLLITALLIFLLSVAAAWLALSAVKLFADRFLPGVTLPTYLIVSATCAALSLAYGVGHLRRKLWRNAFLCFSVVPVIALATLAHFPSPFGLNFVSLWMVCIVLFTPKQSPVPRSEFFLSAFVVSAYLIVLSGFAGSGGLARIISACTLLATVILLGIHARRNRSVIDTPHGASPASA